MQRDKLQFELLALVGVLEHQEAEDSVNMASTRISRTQTGGNRTTWTWSGWIKRGGRISNGTHTLFNALDGSDTHCVRINSDDTLDFHYYSATSGWLGRLNTYKKFFDVSSWYHIVAVWDSTNVTANDRMKLYINGEEITEFGARTNPSSSLDGIVNDNTKVLYIGDKGDGGEYFDGSMSHVCFVDGTALAPSAFGSYDSTDGIWKINTSPSVTYGTNGYYLKFEDSSNLDLDSGTNALTFTTAGNLMANKDNPSNNLCSVNWQARGMVDTTADSNHNCGYTVLIQQSSFRANVGTLPVSAGKWYGEFKLRTATGTSGYAGMGVLNINPNPGDMSAQDPIRIGTYGNGVSYLSDGSVAKGNSTVRTDSTFTAGDIISIAMDLDNGFIYWAKNGTWENSGDPTSGATGTGGYAISNILETGSAGGTDPGSYVMGVTGRVGGSSAPYFDINFGNGWYNTTAIGSPNADGNGYGAFSYAVPSNYLTICTKNISTNG